MTGSPSSDHYSYRHYADPTTAQTFDDRRFGGQIGSLIASEQSRVIANFIGRIKDRDIIDVGTGTGRAALMLARGGARVTAVDASEAMLEVARRRAGEEGVAVKFFHGDAHALDFADRSFDIAMSLRMLMHTPKWRRCVGELCRVSQRLVIVDYPAAMSFALLESLGRRVVHGVGLSREPYQVFADSAINAAFDRCGFRVISRHRQFVLPIAFHKALRSRRLTLKIERLLDRLGLLKLMGSPVTIVAERCASS